MTREQANAIRTILEDWIPPVLRDSRLFYWLARSLLGDAMDRNCMVRLKAGQWSERDLMRYYMEELEIKRARLTQTSENSEACIRRICEDIVGPTACDMGAGSGYLLGRIRDARPDLAQLVGVDVALAKDADWGQWIEASLEALPFPDRSIDTVVCTHTLEHVIDLQTALSELRRVTARRLIVVVPRERPYYWTFNPHLHFFPYPHSLMLAMRPEGEYVLESIGRDLYYREERSD
jgi:SAM-dependent methyltransferase